MTLKIIVLAPIPRARVSTGRRGKTRGRACTGPEDTRQAAHQLEP